MNGGQFTGGVHGICLPKIASQKATYLQLHGAAQPGGQTQDTNCASVSQRAIMLAVDISYSDGNQRGVGIWQDLFEFRKHIGYYQILKGSLITFTEKMTHNL